MWLSLWNVSTHSNQPILINQSTVSKSSCGLFRGLQFTLCPHTISSWGAETTPHPGARCSGLSLMSPTLFSESALKNSLFGLYIWSDSFSSLPVASLPTRPPQDRLEYNEGPLWKLLSSTRQPREYLEKNSDFPLCFVFSYGFSSTSEIIQTAYHDWRASALFSKLLSSSYPQSTWIHLLLLEVFQFPLAWGCSSCIRLYQTQSGPELYKTSSDFSFNDASLGPPVPHHLYSICSLCLISLLFFIVPMTGHLHVCLFLCSIHSQEEGSWFCSHPTLSDYPRIATVIRNVVVFWQMSKNRSTH